MSRLVAKLRGSRLLIALSALLVSGSWALARDSLTIVHMDPPDIGVFFGPPQDIDLNGDGFVDFVFQSTQSSFDVVPQATNAAIAWRQPPPDIDSYATPLLANVEVGPLPPAGLSWVPAENFSGEPIGPTFTACRGDRGCLGDFTGLDAFLGVRFAASDGLHYGWIRVSVPFIGVNGGWIHEWAYDTRPGTPILAGAGGSGSVTGPASPFESVGLPDRFVCTLAQRGSNYSFFAGQGGFKIECTRLLFDLNLAEPFTDFTGAILATASRQVRVDLGAGELVAVSLCEPVQIPGDTNFPPVWIGCDGFYSAQHFSGEIPLTETLRRELQAGQAELWVFLDESWAGSFPVSTLASGSLLALPQPGATNPTPCWPRAPRSTTVRYVPGPAFQMPWQVWWNPRLLDVTSDGIPDYGFRGETLCTMFIPPFCVTCFGVSCVASNQLLARGGMAAVVELGTPIGPVTPTDSAWTAGVLVLTSFRSGAEGYQPWTGDLGRLGEGYLAACVRLADGEHYGWIRVRLPGNQVFQAVTNESGVMFPVELAPVIEDWAFESEPDVPILAGAKPYPVPVQSLGLGLGRNLLARVATQPGWRYALQRKTSLSEVSWQNMGFFVAFPDTRLELPTTGAQGFYRVVEAE